MKLIAFSLFLVGLAKDARADGGLRSLAGHTVDLDRNVIHCTEDSPCGECMGDCQKDSHCMGDLICYQKRGRAKTEEEATVPGCIGYDWSKTDWCVDPEAVEANTPRGDATCNEDGTHTFPDYGVDSQQRLLLREGVIDEIPANICEAREGKIKKNVILVVGDGMGWEMIRAGAIARQVIDELEELGCDTKTGCPDNEAAKDAFSGRSLADYYTEGKGSGLSFQELADYALVTTAAPVLQQPNDGNHYAPRNTLLEGSTGDHSDRSAPLFMNQCGFPYEFNPNSLEDGGDMANWDDAMGGEFPWDERYYQESHDASDGFDPEFILQHGTDSASTAGSYATGHKGVGGMLSQNLYEEDMSTIIEDAMKCGMAGGVVSSVPMFHATPAAFILHSNNRSNRDQLRTSWLKTNPTMVSGVCGGRYYPYEEDLQSMRDGPLSSQWTLFEQNNMTMAEDFYNGIEDLDPDNGDHVLVCVGGDFTSSGQSNMPYRGVDSTFSNRWCSSGEQIIDPDSELTIGINLTTPDELCNHYEPEELQQIPTIQENVKQTLEFLAKDDDGFFMMYEQGDIDWSAHANHMDDMLGAMLDIDDSVRMIMDWIEENGGYEKNALYVTADHDHYLTLNDHFPEALATFMIAGDSHNITPMSNSGVNAWSAAINAGRTEDSSKSQTEHLADFTTWTEEELEQVAHFWGPRGSGGNGWGSHSTRPIPLSYMGDDGCLEQLMGAPYRVVGKEVAGSPGKVDQVHVHACMYKNLFGL
eukprot:CAMPEP_0117001948 /NCGR_PEP_ID=MMETSP0472-20121206/3775_1 /TAXON_ID=693140 ORGANISM="Tiarina fusus, Strain LIS" /NCGR_SAMPLE_ID=MMETSP0472 /ASSEMBLY_ACC=CAM_ASM_000603 /LENGTH=754 /DNA_ID=CAMNT_0004702121 /DNA_START=45 /DNA_END=2309 /DNA_ORIENTATION=+